MSTLTSAARRASTSPVPPEKPTPANAFVLERMAVMAAPLQRNPDGSFDKNSARERLIDYKVVKATNGTGRELQVTYVGPEGYKHTVNMTDQTVSQIITHPMADKFDKMTLTAGLCAMRVSVVDYGLNKY